MDIQDERPEGDQDSVDIGEAARRLGLSVDAVRKRLARGTLAGVKAGDRWRVYLPTAAGTRPESTSEASGELVQVLRDQVEDLRRRLDQAERDRTELQQLVHQAQQLAAAHLLPAPRDELQSNEPASTSEPEPSQSQRRALWRGWSWWPRS